MSKPKTTETKPVSDADRKAEEYRSKIERDETIAAAKAEFLQKLADIGVTTEHAETILHSIYHNVYFGKTTYVNSIKFSDFLAATS